MPDVQPIITKNVLNDGVTIEFDNTQQQTLFSLEEFTVNSAKTIQQLKSSLKTTNEMINEGLLQDSGYAEVTEEFKEMQKGRNGMKKKLLMSGNLGALAQKAKNIRDELKEQKNSMSDYALEYQRMSGATEIVRDGVTYDIIKVAKLVKRMS